MVMRRGLSADQRCLVAMRLDANKGDRGFVWHCVECRKIDHCVWVDDETCEYAVHMFGPDGKYVISGKSILKRVHKAKKIRITRGAQWIVLIDPIDDRDVDISITVDASQIADRLLEQTKKIERYIANR